MEMHQLRYAVAVARSGNFSRAAEQCHVAQPSLSQQIMKLEEELGERLFDRAKREARLTPHGEIFLQRAIRILEEVDAAKRDAENAKRYGHRYGQSAVGCDVIGKRAGPGYVEILEYGTSGDRRAIVAGDRA